MKDRRRDKRLELKVSLQLGSLNEGHGKGNYIQVEVFDLSKSGMGFWHDRELELGTFYDARLQIWTKEVIDVVIELVRCEKRENKYSYGAVFVGLTEKDALKIQIYEMFNQN